MANPQIRMKADRKTAEILIYEDIGESWFGGLSAKRFADTLKSEASGAEVLQIRINSAGGDVFDGLAIYNTLRRHNARKEVSIDGMALSIASVIAMAGDHIAIANNAMLMIHNPWTVAMGTEEDLRQQADLLATIKDNLIGTYARRTKADSEHIREMMQAETWMNGADALDEGFVDEVTSDLAIAAHFDVTRFKNVPRNLWKRAQQAQAVTPRADLVRAKLQEFARRASAA